MAILIAGPCEDQVGLSGYEAIENPTRATRRGSHSELCVDVLVQGCKAHILNNSSKPDKKPLQ